METISAPSPNFDNRTAPPSIILLHYTGMPTGEGALARLRDPAAKVSSHYLVEEDGRVFSLVAEERRAWHAGVSFWRGRRNVDTSERGFQFRKTSTKVANGLLKFAQLNRGNHNQGDRHQQDS